MENILSLEHQDISDLSNWIIELRGRKVILDFQLAFLYKVETKYLKRSVKANINRFPSDFMFELTKEEVMDLRCRNLTSNGRGGNRYMPFAFTQEGVQLINASLAEMHAERDFRPERKKIGFK